MFKVTGIIFFVIVCGITGAVTTPQLLGYKTSANISYSSQYGGLEFHLKIWSCKRLDPDPKLNGSICTGIRVNQDGVARTRSHGGR